MKESYVIPLFIAGTILFVVFVFFIIFFILLNKQKRNRLIIEKQKAIFEEQERTMTQISKDVHDNLGGLLTLAMMNMQVIKEYAVNDDQMDAIKNSSGILSQLISDVQDISHSMNSNYIKKRGLYDILESQLRYIAAAKNIKCNVEITGEENILNADEDLLVYRIAQEAIQNAMRHAAATQLTISLNYGRDLFSMTITDNGVGYKQGNALEKHGLGLVNMHERASILNGTLNIKSAPGEGCSILFRMRKDYSSIFR